MRKKTSSVGLPGVSSLITILAVLCIAVFAVLALSTALSSRRLSDAALKHSREYYAAVASAEEQIADLRSKGTEGTKQFSVPISETLALAVEADFTPDGKAEITRFQQVYAADWTADESLDVWDGE